jgi:hypothetical protein
MTLNKHTMNVSYGVFHEKPMRLQTDGTGNAYLAAMFMANDTLGTIPLSYAVSGNLVLSKYQSSSGNVQWAKTGGLCVFFELATNFKGTSYLAFSGSFSPHYFGDSTFSQSFPSPQGDVTVVGLDSFGTISCGYALGGSAGDDEIGVMIDKDGFGYVYGDFMDSIKIGNTVLQSGTLTSEAYFAARFSCPGLVTAQVFTIGNASAAPQLYPNPAGGQLFITKEADYRSFAIYNMFGQKVLDGALRPGLTTTDVDMLPAGVYIVIFHGDSGEANSKFVKM